MRTYPVVAAFALLALIFGACTTEVEVTREVQVTREVKFPTEVQVEVSEHLNISEDVVLRILE